MSGHHRRAAPRQPVRVDCLAGGERAHGSIFLVRGREFAKFIDTRTRCITAATTVSCDMTLDLHYRGGRVSLRASASVLRISEQIRIRVRVILCASKVYNHFYMMSIAETYDEKDRNIAKFSIRFHDGILPRIFRQRKEHEPYHRNSDP